MIYGDKNVWTSQVNTNLLLNLKTTIILSYGCCKHATLRVIRASEQVAVIPPQPTGLNRGVHVSYIGSSHPTFVRQCHIWFFRNSGKTGTDPRPICSKLWNSPTLDSHMEVFVSGSDPWGENRSVYSGVLFPGGTDPAQPDGGWRHSFHTFCSSVTSSVI